MMIHKPSSGTAPEGEGFGIVERLQARLQGKGYEAVVRRLPPGVLVDGVILARSGMVGLTLSRGDWSTLRVVHTESDRADRVNVAAAFEAGRAAADAVRDFLG